MALKFNVLQIGGADLEYIIDYKQQVVWDYLDVSLFQSAYDYLQNVKDVVEANGKFDFVFVQTAYSDALLEVLNLVSTPYNTYIDENYWDTNFEQSTVAKKNFIRPLSYDSQIELEEKLEAITFSGQYGDKVYPKYCTVSPNFSGEMEYIGNKYLVLSGDFGKVSTPIASWRNSVVCDKEKGTQIWPEFKTEGTVKVEYTFRVIQSGTVDTVIEEHIVDEQALEHPIEIKARPKEAYVSVSVKASGEGKLYIGAIHKRWSRKELGQFILGGKRFVDENREEFFHYFNPGDMKPPLNVYFSGYRSQEGFEGYFMMNDLDAPFLLLSDPRIEGGAFYLGSEAYENAIQNTIREKLAWLGFKPQDLVLSGLSMGSFAALYYGAHLNPAGIVIGKPLINVGTVADNMTLKRPEDFGTALDVLMKNEGDLTQKDIDKLNGKFWNVMKQATLKDITFAIAYMKHDDYDTKAFSELLPLLSSQQARVMSRAVPGRHNDDSPTITSWFVNFYYIILESRFGRVNK